MLYWAAVFFVIAIIAAIFGFGGIAAGATSIAQVLFFIFLILFVVTLIGGLFKRPRTPTQTPPPLDGRFNFNRSYAVLALRG